MKPLLLYPDRDFQLEAELPPQAAALTQDLELDTMLAAMAAGDGLLFDFAKRALLLGLHDPETIVYRQQVVRDFLGQPDLVRELYALAGEALKAEKSVWIGGLRESPRSLLSGGVQRMELFVGFLRRLREVADEHGDGCSSAGLTRFFAMLRSELAESYLQEVESELNDLGFRAGMLMSAQLGAGNKGTHVTLRRPREQGLLARVFDRSGHSFTVPERDDNGLRALSDLEDKAVNLVANALRQAVDHVHSFFWLLQAEVGFYVACLNLSERLAERGASTAFPEPVEVGTLALSATGLYDVSLRLATSDPVVTNDVAADGKSLIVITGANQGGKSTFLRSAGLAQLMMQSGMFVGAQSLRASVCAGLFTHFKREEDEAMESGKLDEELARMSDIADHLAPNCLLLCNESFASTNEREGTQIARQVVTALLDSGVKVLFVTHMFELADGLYQAHLGTALFLRAERGSDGARPFKLSEGEPLPTSYGEDSYRKVFGTSVRTVAAS